MPKNFARWGLTAVAVAALVGAVALSDWTLRAQDRGRAGDARRQPRARVVAPEPAPIPDAGAPPPPTIPVQEALVRPFDIPFDRETSLEEVRRHLAKALNAPVVLDRAALDLLELTPEDTVQLELKGVRLKVGLKLLLDQVGLSYKVVPEDNLLILTAPESASDPAERVLAEIKTLHKEFHDLQDAIDDLRDLVEEELGIEPEPPKEHSAIVRWKGRPGPARDPRPAPRPGRGGA